MRTTRAPKKSKAPAKAKAAGAIAARYAADVVAGRQPAGRLIVQACARHLADLDHGGERGIFFDAAAAQRACDFFRFLRHSKGEWAGQPIALEAWQTFLVASLFGWRRRDGRRRFRSFYGEIPRKNGKSTLAAGVALYLLAADGEPGAEVYCAATKREQARIVFDEIKRMIRHSPALARRFTVLKENISLASTASKCEPLASDEEKLDGLNVHAAIVDELHAHKTRGVYELLETATGARRQPLLFAITTAGHDRHSICWEQRSYAVRVLEGTVLDDNLFALIYSADAGDDWRGEVAWRKANPNLGVSVKLDDLIAKAAKAAELPSSQHAFRRLHLDEWVEESATWLTGEAWDGCRSDCDDATLLGRECWAGLDLSSTTDITALVLAFPQGTGWRLVPHFWIPRESAHSRSLRDRVPYLAWLDQGLIEGTEGNVVDYEVVRRRIHEIKTLFKIRSLAIDPWNATQLATQLEGDGLPVAFFRQGFASMNAPAKEFEKLILSRKIAHDGHAVLRWMALNAAIETDAAGNIKPCKKRSRDRIDGIVAAIMALGAAMAEPVKKESVYNQRGILRI